MLQELQVTSGHPQNITKNSRIMHIKMKNIPQNVLDKKTPKKINRD
jgi:hypothetical protein